MADQDLSHTADIIKAAIPYVDSNLKGMAELFAKALDLLGSLKTIGKSDHMAAYGFQASKIDIEGLLKGIRPILNNKEREFIDRILNIFNMKRMYETYNSMMQTMKTMQEFGGFNFGDSASENDTDNVTGNFSGPNFESIFQSFANMNWNNSNDTTEKNESEFSSNHSEAADKNSSEATSASANDKENNSFNSGQSGNPMNNKMFDMLKAMVPPEQMSTFENLSMLFNTMSYDNNSKPDENKERNDG